MENATVLDWDSEHFGVKIGFYKLPTLTPDGISKLLQWCSEEKIKCLYFLADPDCPDTARLAAEHGFVLVDIRLTLDRAIQKDSRFESDKNIRPANPGDLKALTKIAEDSFDKTRFYFDEHFPRQKCRELYSIWAGKSLNSGADVVLVYELEENRQSFIKGFITCSKHDQQGKIGLFAVSKEASGKGIGSLLVNAALDWFQKAGCSNVEVVTQGRNISAQRCYQGFGFKTKKVQHWYHRWF